MKTSTIPITLLLLLLLVALYSNCGVKDVPNDNPQEPGGVLPPDRFVQIDLKCSETEVRTVEATITALLNKQSLSDYRLDVTLYKEGFDRSWFITLLPIQPGNKFTKAVSETTIDPSIFIGLDLQVDSNRFTREGQLLREIKVTGFEAGKNYIFRLMEQKQGEWETIETTRFTAPICVADMIDDN